MGVYPDAHVWEWVVGSGQWAVSSGWQPTAHYPLPTPNLSSAIQLLQFTHRQIIALEPALVRAEGRCVIDAAAVDGARAVFHMEHFVIEHEFDHILRDRRAV